MNASRAGRAPFAAALLAAVAFSGACGPRVREPEVRLDRIRVGGLGLEGGVLNVSLRVVNPNDFGLEASALEYRLELADSSDASHRWVKLAEDRRSQEIRVPARDSAIVEIPVHFEYRDLGGAIRSLLSRGTLDYRVSGRVQVEEPLRRAIPFRKTGAVDIFD